jgi:hypothetical protein
MRMVDGRRNYTATNRKGEEVKASVHDSGQGFRIFWDKVLAKWPKAYA